MKNIFTLNYATPLHVILTMSAVWPLGRLLPLRPAQTPGLDRSPVQIVHPPHSVVTDKVEVFADGNQGGGVVVRLGDEVGAGGVGDAACVCRKNAFNSVL